LSSRDWRKEKPKWRKKLNVVKFKERVPCPYCPPDSPDFPSNLALCRHVLREHNWNNDFLKDFEVVETYGSVLIAKKITEESA
jgi:hypothetical protein